MSARRSIGAAALLSIAASLGAQQPQVPATRITPDTGELSLGTKVVRAGNEYVIDGGTRAGSNVFHSFSHFDLAGGDLARWTWTGADPSGIRNLVSRVTAGEPSMILGTIDSSDLPNADFWFVNPAGILFGPGAAINVPAAAHFSTAQELRFDDGQVFAIATPGGSTLSIGAPSAYGFVGGQGSISVAGAAGDLLPASGRSLSLAGADVTITGSDFIAGRLDLVAAGTSATMVSLADPLAASLSGTLILEDSHLQLSGRAGPGRGFFFGGGTVDVRSSGLGTRFSEDPDANASAPITLKGDRVTLESSGISTEPLGSEPAGTVSLLGREVHITGRGSVIQSGVFDGRSSATAGLIRIAGDDVRIDGNAFLLSSTETAQRGGEIRIEGGRVTIDEATIASRSQFGATGDGGDITITGSALSLSGGTEIDSSTIAFGKAGSVVIDVAGPVTISQASVSSDSLEAFGDAGLISIAASNLSLSNSASISTATSAGGNGGRIGLRVGALALDDAMITTGSSAEATGRPGSIAIDAGAVALVNGGTIASEAANASAAGSVSITARNLSLIEGGEISTSSKAGAAGDISILMARDGLLRLAGREEGSRITTSSGPGTGGRIRISEPRAIISDGGSILALGQQGGANVQIQTGFFIRSADRDNRVAVNGDFLLEAQVGDVSSGTVERDLSILDASGVLRGQCAAVRASGRVSQLIVRPVGPYAPASPGACR